MATQSKQGDKLVLTYNFAEVIRTYREGIERGRTLGPRHRELVEEQRENSGNFYGGTPEDMLKTLKRGYEPPSGAKPTMDVQTFEGDGIAWRWSDEDGEYEHSEFLAGEPEFFLDRRRVPGKPGIAVQVGMQINCSMDSSVVADYGEWVAATLRELGRLGYDVSLTAYSELQSLQYTLPDGSDGHDMTFVVRVVVKKFGEILLPQDYLTLFSRTGYRHLFFTACIMDEARGASISGGLGYPVHNTDWAVGWDPDTRVLQITAPPSSREFPKEGMDRMLKEVANEF